MPDEQVEPTIETPQEPTTPEPAPEPVPEPEPGQGAEPTAEPEKEPEPGADLPPVEPPLPKTYKLKVEGEEWEKTEDEVVQLAQQGAHYSKKMADLSAAEKAFQQRKILENVVANDPIIWKMAMARQHGYDPNVVFANPQPPPAWLKESDPEGYIRDYIAYESQIQQKATVERSLNQFIATAAQTTNQGVIAKARLTHNLTEEENRKVMEFMAARMKPDQFGAFSDQDAEYAVFATLGKDRLKEAKLQTSESIRKQIKQVAKAQPKKPVSQKSETIDPKKKADREYLEYVKEHSGG